MMLSTALSSLWTPPTSWPEQKQPGEFLAPRPQDDRKQMESGEFLSTANKMTGGV